MSMPEFLVLMGKNVNVTICGTGLFEDTLNTEPIAASDYMPLVYELWRPRFEAALEWESYWNGGWCD